MPETRKRYSRKLPHGPHRIPRAIVDRDQRVRLTGATIHVLRSQEKLPTVAQILAVAGVSRRAFYTHFTNMEECFLAICCMLLIGWKRTLTAACAACHGDIEERLQFVLRALAREVRKDPFLVKLAIVRAQDLGLTGTHIMQQVSEDFEEMLIKAFTREGLATPLPRPLATAIVGGLQRMMYTAFRYCDTEEIPDLMDSLVQDMVAWVMLFHSPVVTHLPNESWRPPVPLIGPRVRPDETSSDPWARLRSSVQYYAAQRNLKRTLETEITNLAKVSPEWFAVPMAARGNFKNRFECFLAAFVELRSELLELISIDENLDRWPTTVRQSIGSIVHYFSTSGLYAKTIAIGAFSAGAGASEENLRLSRDVVSKLLGEMAPLVPHEFLIDALGGAIWYTIGAWLGEAPDARTSVSPAELADHLAYLVLAPFAAEADLIELIENKEATPVRVPGVKPKTELAF